MGLCLTSANGDQSDVMLHGRRHISVGGGPWKRIKEATKTVAGVLKSEGKTKRICLEKCTIVMFRVMFFEGLLVVTEGRQGSITIPQSNNSATFSSDTILVFWFSIVLDFLTPDHHIYSRRFIAVPFSCSDSLLDVFTDNHLVNQVSTKNGSVNRKSIQTMNSGSWPQLWVLKQARKCELVGRVEKS